MKKPYLYEELKIAPTTNYIRTHTEIAWEKFQEQKKIIYDWLNKTDAPKEVWDVCETHFQCSIA